MYVSVHSGLSTCASACIHAHKLASVCVSAYERDHVHGYLHACKYHLLMQVSYK